MYKEAIPWEQWVLPPTAVAGPVRFADDTNLCLSAPGSKPPSPSPSPSPSPNPPSPSPPSPPPLTSVPVWPLPLKLDCVPPADSSSGYSGAPTVPLLSSSVTITLAGSGSGTRVSQAAAARYQLLLRAAGSAAGVVTKVVVTVQASNSSLGMGTNYSYSIISGTTTTTTTNTASAGVAGLNAAAAVNVLAATPFAVAYAMETLLQLAAPAAQKICGGGFTVVDEPTYVHRGILLDTGRRFFPTAVVKTTIESMAMFKLNVLHFHLSEGRFRVESTTYPELNLPCSNKTCPESGECDTDDSSTSDNCFGRLERTLFGCADPQVPMKGAWCTPHQYFLPSRLQGPPATLC